MLGILSFNPHNYSKRLLQFIFNSKENRLSNVPEVTHTAIQFIGIEVNVRITTRVKSSIIKVSNLSYRSLQEIWTGDF